jgi:hypothetical protein
MRGQLSLEFMLYLAATGASLVFSLAIFGGAQTKLGPQISQVELYALVSAINARFGYQQSSFYAFVPAAFCGAEFNSSVIVYDDVSYQFYAPLIVADGICANSGIGGSRLLSMTQYLNGTYLLS